MIEHVIIISCPNAVSAPADERRFIAECSCGWKATGKGDKGEVRVGRKADAHLYPHSERERR